MANFKTNVPAFILENEEYSSMITGKSLGFLGVYAAVLNHIINKLINRNK